MIAVFDIGKTNKKCFIFNEDYQIVYEKTSQLIETTDEDGEPCENIDLLKNWILDTLREILNDFRFLIKAINVTTYGASLVHLDIDGQPLTPLYNYLRPFPDDLKEQFLTHYGDESKIALETASPVLGNLNSGLQLYWLKYQKPLIFKQIKWSLHLPQYITFLIFQQLQETTSTESVSFRTEGEESEAEGRSKHFENLGLRPQMPRYALHDNIIGASEITSIGCHTMMWNFQKNDYHDWVKTEGLTEKFPPLKPSNLALPIINTLITNYQSTNNYIGTGLHDSSAALIPYLASFKEPFILISTGTWCISLNPFNAEPLTAEELKQDCLSYLSYEGKPVKAARYFGGNQHEIWTQKLAQAFNKPADYYQTIAFDQQIIESQHQQKKLRQTGLYPFENYEAAYHTIISKIIRQQYHSTKMVLTKTTHRIFVDGGFSKNEIYMNLLAQVFPHLEVYAAEVAQATALGAALAIHTFWNEKPLPDNLISLKKYSISRS